MTGDGASPPPDRGRRLPTVTTESAARPDTEPEPPSEAAIGRIVGELWAAIEHGDPPPGDLDPRLVRRVRAVRSALGRP